MGFEKFKNLFIAARKAPATRPWDTQIQTMVSEFRGARAAWFELCVELTQNDPNAISNPTLSGTAETTACIYQLMDAMEFIAGKQYVKASDGQEFANKLFAEITYGLNPTEKYSLSKRLYGLRQKADASDVLDLCFAVAERILTTSNLEMTMKIAYRVRLFTHITYCIVALSFDDQATLKLLEKETERMLKG